ncbi:hypothetical protein [Paenibacillus thalictri]|uniref:Uncharacterized protein n=1 Tax=Paenibacillus thalictri TaxID=2527873 RepID=A0A4Q9DHD9_9BACL|nr:hypothetical protein [Paenibacillus thalictri]TBL69404.1 hypothetical protein EYB31_36055 [Paenibacillus thalictri]
MYFKVSSIIAGIVSLLYAISWVSSAASDHVMLYYKEASVFGNVMGIVLGLALFNFFIALLKTFRTENS